MSSKQTRPHSPAGTRLRGPDRDGNYEIMIPSERAPGVWHTLDVAYTGDALGCTCPGYRRYLDYLASLRTATPLPARRPCWHVEGAAGLLAHHRDRPPADPGGAALDAAQADADKEINDWVLGGKLSPTPWLVGPGERRRRHDEPMRDLYGSRAMAGDHPVLVAGDGGRDNRVAAHGRGLSGGCPRLGPYTEVCMTAPTARAVAGGAMRVTIGSRRRGDRGVYVGRPSAWLRGGVLLVVVRKTCYTEGNETGPGVLVAPATPRPTNRSGRSVAMPQSTQPDPVPQPPATRHCTACHQGLPPDHFARDKYGRDGLVSQCRACRAARRRRPRLRDFTCVICAAPFRSREPEAKTCSRACDRARRRRPRKNRQADCHPARSHYAGGLCSICYSREKYRRLYACERKPRKRKPVTCGHPDRPHSGKGMCKACYCRHYAKNNQRQTRARCHPDRPMRAKGLCDSCYAGQQNRRRDTLLAGSDHHTQAEWEALVALHPACPCCARPWSAVGEPTRDHIIPVSKGGQDTIGNIQPLCFSCNSRKQDRAVRYIEGSA